ncbi:DUF6538 domain-containing protein [Mameliella alba]|uniref:DUF6538 domain-containing protein n=1 Tax=Mameliella alba TaxID=561184 RepID=UPI0035EBD7BB
MPGYLRGSTYHLKRRVPTRYAKVERRTFIKMSLRTYSPGVARHKAEEVWDQLLAHSGRPCSRAIRTWPRFVTKRHRFSPRPES